MSPGRVLVYGSVGPATGGLSYARAFERAGWEARTFSGSAGLEHYRKSLTLRLFTRLRGQIRESDRAAHVAALAAEVAAFRPDILLATGGHYLSADDVRRFRDGGAWVANVNHDDFFSRYRSNWTWTQRRAIPAYDAILTTRTVNVEEIRPLNPNVHFFSFSYDPDVHRPVAIPPEERAEWESDVVFVGQRARHRSRVIESLVRAVPASYAIRGPGWDGVGRLSSVRPFVKGYHVWGDDMAKALGGAKIALGFLRKENRDDYTQRTFEIPACGGLLLAERTPKHTSIFREGVEAEFFDPDRPDELIAKVRALLADDARRDRIRRAGMEALWRGPYTYDDRVREVLALIPHPSPAIPAP
jgi:spore maturation protein CgeB